MKKSLLKMYRSLKKIAKIFLWIVGILVIAFVVYDQYTDWTYYKKVYASRDFSPALWDQAGKAMSSKDRSPGDILYGISPRCGMYDDLKKNYLKKSMHISEVEKLLGKSISTSYCMDKKIKCSNYVLGTCYSNALTISSNTLHVCFGEDQRIIDVGKGRFHREICNGNIISCFDGEEKCDCYKNDEAMGKECSFKVDKW